ncbi:hypothetical protein RCL1_004930 [Eukaryota sp. TZLM3-RCL]
MSVQFLIELFSGTERQGPGNRDTTLRALNSVRSKLPHSPTVLDVGCGTGGSTLVLAEECPSASIIATDIEESFLSTLRASLTIKSLKNVQVENVSMLDLKEKYQNTLFDLVFAEGSLYIMNFYNALSDLSKITVPSGFVIASNAVYLKPKTQIPQHVLAFWEQEGGGIEFIDDTIQHISTLGYSIIEHFVFDSSCWDAYYGQLPDRLSALESKYPNNPDCLSVVQQMRNEINIVSTNLDYVNYVFYVLQKN